MKSILIVQHCQSEHHIRGMAGGWTDTPLTELGRKQAESIGIRLAAENFDEGYSIHSSDLMRTSQTAEIISKHTNMKIHLCHGLREIDIGEETQKSVEWLRQNQTPMPLQDDGNFLDYRLLPGAETKREFYYRTTAFLDELNRQIQSNVVIVTHGGTVTNIVFWWLKIPIEALNSSYMRCFPGSITYLEEDALGYRYIKGLNDTRHLDNV